MNTVFLVALKEIGLSFFSQLTLSELYSRLVYFRISANECFRSFTDAIRVGLTDAGVSLADVDIFAGAGSLEDAVRVRAAENGQENAVRYLGWRNDVGRQRAVKLWEMPAPSRVAALEAFRASPMDMDAALEDMMRLHR